MVVFVGSFQLRILQNWIVDTYGIMLHATL
jgi:hypothetical protein